MANVLADRHHAGLYQSLQLLGDRLGWTVYTPVGTEWWAEGYWRFGQVFGDDRLARQYLSLTEARDPLMSIPVTSWSGWQGRDGFYVARDPEFPERDIVGVTLAQARTMWWDVVMPTVQENQAGFARFAREHGAKYVYQVGNTRQQIDWSLEPLVIASSEVNLNGRSVRYHQEMHPAYRWHEPKEANRWRIASFVHLMPRIECWPTLWEHAKLLTEFEFRIHGADCPAGIIQPTSAIAQAMAESGWGWHDKITGDGFGHVLWGWAAVGRPIIGHASHYAGKLGEVLWRDLETCIDLDLHPPDEAVGLIRDIAYDPARHAAMCRAMRAAFEAHYDPERDAQAIGELLA